MAVVPIERLEEELALAEHAEERHHEHCEGTDPDCEDCVEHLLDVERAARRLEEAKS